VRHTTPACCNRASGPTEAFSLLGHRALDVRRRHALRREFEGPIFERLGRKLARTRLGNPSQHPLSDIGRQYLAETCGGIYRRRLTSRDRRPQRSGEE
jgi:hypothetical protein